MRHVVHRHADIFRRPVLAVQRFNRAAQRAEQVRRLVCLGVAPDHRLAAAQRQVGHGILVAHAFRQTQHVRERIVRRRIIPHPASARRRPARRRVNGDDRAKPRLLVEDMVNAFVASKRGFVEHGERLRCHRSARLARAYTPKPPVRVNRARQHELAYRRAFDGLAARIVPASLRTPENAAESALVEQRVHRAGVVRLDQLVELGAAAAPAVASCRRPTCSLRARRLPAHAHARASSALPTPAPAGTARLRGRSTRSKQRPREPARDWHSPASRAEITSRATDTRRTVLKPASCSSSSISSFVASCGSAQAEANACGGVFFVRRVVSRNTQRPSASSARKMRPTSPAL